MRALVAAATLALVATPAAAERLPSGAIGVVVGPVSGTGADAKRLGAGIHFGGQAAWQPMSTDRPWGWSLKWSALFGYNWGGTAAQIESRLLTVQMDLLVGLRFRPWTASTRYLTLRGGAGLLRANEPIPTSNDTDAEMKRAFLGPVATVGLDQHLWGSALLNVDVRYGLIGGGPEQIALVIGFGVTGP